MSKPCFPTPTIAPLHRLHVYDSLMMNAQRWQLAHDYHRRRQNIHYQALNQPGIVCGLGIVRPSNCDGRMIEIQPGIAIDVEGNVIVVDPEVDRTFRIAAKAPTNGRVTVYVVVSYVEPEKPFSQYPPETLQEVFRFDQKTAPPTDHEIELCRIHINSDFAEVEYPNDILSPGENQLDFRYRRQAQARPLALVTAAQVAANSNGEKRILESTFAQANLAKLMSSLAALYPPLQGDSNIKQVLLTEISKNYDLLMISDSQLLQREDRKLDQLAQHLKTGGLLLVETRSYYEEISVLFDRLTALHSKPLRSWQDIEREHPLRSQPFLFSTPPTLGGEVAQIWCGGGIVVISANLAAAWGGDERLNLSRNDIRAAQELGINILNFAHRRRSMTQLLDPSENELSQLAERVDSQ